MKINLTRIFLYVLLFIFIMTFISNCNKNQQLTTYEQNIKSLTEDITKTRNSQNEEMAKVRSLTFENSKQFLELNSSKKSIVALQTEIKRLKGKSKESTIVYVESTTEIQGSVDTVFKTIVNGDTLFTGKLNKYGDWITGEFTLGKDTSNYSITVVNEFVGSYYYERDKGLRNLFSPKHPVFEITNKNPYTVTKDLQVVSISKNKFKDRLSVIGGVGYGIDLRTFKPTPIFGLSIGYKLIDL